VDSLELERHLRAMPLSKLTDTELQSAAQAARIAREEALADASKQSSPSIRRTFESSAEHFAKLAEKFEGSRFSSTYFSSTLSLTCLAIVCPAFATMVA
jgi:hypothetical protein